MVMMVTFSIMVMLFVVITVTMISVEEMIYFSLHVMEKAVVLVLTTVRIVISISIMVVMTVVVTMVFITMMFIVKVFITMMLIIMVSSMEEMVNSCFHPVQFVLHGMSMMPTMTLHNHNLSFASALAVGHRLRISWLPHNSSAGGASDQVHLVVCTLNMMFQFSAVLLVGFLDVTVVLLHVVLQHFRT